MLGSAFVTVCRIHISGLCNAGVKAAPTEGTAISGAYCSVTATSSARAESQSAFIEACAPPLSPSHHVLRAYLRPIRLQMTAACHNCAVSTRVLIAVPA